MTRTRWCQHFFKAALGNLKYDVAQTERLASEVIELSARYNFAQWLPSGNILRGWAQRFR